MTDLTTATTAPTTERSAHPRFIYGLADTQGRVRYVGQSNDPRSRLGSHLQRAETGTTPLYAWLRELTEPPTVVILQAVLADEANRAERDWILRLREEAAPDAPLLNVKPYADGWPRLTAEHKAKIGAANRGRRLSPEARAKISAGRKGRRLSAEHRAALSAGHLGVPKSVEHRAAISAGLRRFNASNRAEVVPCPACGRPCRGSRGFAAHLQMKPACRTLPVL